MTFMHSVIIDGKNNIIHFCQINGHLKNKKSIFIKLVTIYLLKIINLNCSLLQVDVLHLSNDFVIMCYLYLIIVEH